MASLETEGSSKPRRVLVRVKRRRDASPVEALVVKASSAKRQKTIETSSGADATHGKDENAVFTLLGTSTGDGSKAEVDGGRHVVEPHILEKLGKKGVLPPSRDKRTPLKKTSHKQGSKSKKDDSARRADKRFTLIQSKRNVSLVTDTSHSKELLENNELCDVITLGQVESPVGGDQKVTCNGVPGKEDFVYDIYCLQDQPMASGGSGVQNTSFSEQDWKDVKAYFDELEDEDGSDDNLQSDSEDSNAEEHWRNDYPDELSDDEDEEVLYGGGAAQGRGGGGGRMRDYYNDEVVSIDSGSDPSEGHEGLCYTRDEGEEGVANRHGSAYARFKSKIMRDFANMGLDDKNGEESSETSDDDDIDEDDRIALEDGLD